MFGGAVPTGARCHDDADRAVRGAFIVDTIVPGSPREWWLVGLQLDDSGGLAGVTQGEWWRLITASFLHAGILHLLFNMYALYLFGPSLEALFGHGRFAVLYSCRRWVAQPPDTLRGSGATVARGLRCGVRHPRRDARGGPAALRRPCAVGALIAINLVLGFVIAGIDWRAHLGGLITGMAVAYAFAYAPRERRTLVGAGASGPFWPLRSAWSLSVPLSSRSDTGIATRQAGRRIRAAVGDPRSIAACAMPSSSRPYARPLASAVEGWRAFTRSTCRRSSSMP